MKDKEGLVPGIKPGKVNYEYYCKYTPEKIELIDGVMFGSEED